MYRLRRYSLYIERETDTYALKAGEEDDYGQSEMVFLSFSILLFLFFLAFCDGLQFDPPKSLLLPISPPPLFFFWAFFFFPTVARSALPINSRTVRAGMARMPRGGTRQEALGGHFTEAINMAALSLSLACLL